MNGKEKEIIEAVFLNFKKVSDSFQIIEEEGGEVYYFILKNRDNSKINIIYNQGLFNINYKEKLPVKEEGIYSKWIPSFIEIMRSISEINNMLLKKSSMEKSFLKKYLNLMSTMSEKDIQKSFEEIYVAAI